MAKPTLGGSRLGCLVLLDPNKLFQISQNRGSIFYSPYLGVDLSAGLQEIDFINYTVGFDQAFQFERDSSNRVKRS